MSAGCLLTLLGLPSCVPEKLLGTVCSLPPGSRPAGLATVWGSRKSAVEPCLGSRANANGITDRGPEVPVRAARTL